ncbi:MAG: hypothetical protein JW829_07875 [Pirellulales bacterium]|nr:hypothetical protein [Pirellulales bacterium]
MLRDEIIIPRPLEQEDEMVDSGGDAPAQPSPLLQQAAEYAKIARAALEDCQRGEKAEQELLLRRNRSGQ